MILRFSYALLLLCCIVYTLNAQTGLSLPDASSCDETIQSFLEEQGIPGASIAIAKDGQLFYTRGLGVVDQASEEPVHPYHRFRIGGVSKTVTAVAVIKLIEEGKLSLDDKVFGDEGIINKGILLEFNITDDRVFDITVGQLLMHTAGWDTGLDCLPYSDDGCDPVFMPLKVTEATGGSNPANKIYTIGFALEQGLQFAPGTDFAYSNVGYLILEQVIARVSRMSYPRFVKTYLMDPLGICDMAIGKTPEEDRQEREVTYHTEQEALSAYGTGETLSAAYGQFNLEALAASNGIISTAEELLRFILAIDGFKSVPDILNEESIDALISTGTANPNYAKGLQIDEEGNWWHLGQLPGSSAAWGRTADGYAWVALFNQEGPLEGETSSSISNSYNDLILKCIGELDKNFKANPDLFVRPVEPTSEIQALVTKETSLVLSWQKGDGKSRLILMKEGSSVDVFPEDGKSYSISDELGEGNFVVYNGNGAAVNLKELNPNTNYHFRIFDYNEVRIGKGQEKEDLPLYRVGCSASANFTTLPLASDCKCLSNRMEDICEDFESFSLLAPVGLQSNCLTTSFGLEGTKMDALISTDTAYNGSQSLLIDGNGENNLVFTLSDRKKGRYKVQWKMLIPQNKKAAFSIQTSQGNPNNPSLSVKLGKDDVDTPMLNGGPDNNNIVPEDEWFTVTQIFDLDNNTLDLMIADDVVVSDFGYDGDLGGVSFFSEGKDSRFFVDDMVVQNIGDQTLDGELPNLTCASSGTLTIEDNILLIEDLEVLNNGEGVAAGSSIGFFLSDNTSFTTLDTYIGENFINGLEPEESIQITFGADISSLDLPPGEYFVGFIIDYKNVVQELDEEDNNDCFFLLPKVIIAPPPMPDLAFLDNGNLTIENDTAKITNLKVTNLGGADSDSTTLAFYLTPNNNVTTFDIEIGSLKLDTIPAGDSVIVNFSRDLSELVIPDNDYKLGVIVDYTEEQEEEDEDNNTTIYSQPIISFPLGEPNLACDSLGSLSITGPIIDIDEVRVVNNGEAGAGSHKIGIYLSTNTNFTDFDELIGEIEVDSLPAGAKLTFSTVIDISGMDINDGTYYVGFIFDNEEVIAESDETDNNDCFFDAPTITLPLIPNLRCDSLGTLTIDGTVVDIQDLKIINDGDAGAGNHSIGIYLSSDTSITAADSLIGEIAVDTLPRNGTLTLSATIDVQGLDLPDGTYFIGILIDKDEEVTELSEEDNDCYYEGMSLTIGEPDLTCADAGTLTITDGLIEITDLKITNIGSLGAGEHVVGIYLSANTNFTTFDELIGEINVDTLAAGDTLTTSFSVDVTDAGIDDGTYFVGFIIDKDEQVEESEEDDNNDCFFNDPTITLPIVGDPDLSCNNSGTLTVESGLVTITDLEILNSGEGPAGTSFVGFYLSTNTTFTELDEFIGEAQVKALEAGESDTITFEVDLDTLDIPVGEYFVGYIIDYKEEVTEILEINNADCYFVTPKVTIEAPKPNLTCESLGTFSVSEALVLEVDDFQVINDGDGAAGGSRVGFYLSTDTDFTTDDIKVGEVFIGGFDTEEVFTIDFSVDISAMVIDPGSYYFGFILDYQENVDELNEEDNTCYQDAPKVEIIVDGDPNLACGDMGTLTIGDDFILNLEDMQVTNNGAGPAGASTLAIYLSTNINITSFDNLILEIPIPALNPGETATVDGQVDLKSLSISTGDYYVGLFFDNDDVVEESNEGDNNDCYFLSPKVSFPLEGEPNLACADAGLLSIDGGEITIADLEVINSGNEDAGAYKIGFYLSEDGNFTTDDILFGSLDVGGTNAGQTIQASFQTTINPADIPDGTYMIGFIIDYLDEIDEQFELDNKCGFKEPTITLPLEGLPDLTCAESGSISCDDWDIFIEDAWIQNTGTGKSEATTICVILSPDQDFTDNDNYQVDYIDLPALEAGESVGITEIIELANFKDIIPYGTYYIALVIDCDDNVLESYEDNNICYYEKTITLENPDRPDLVCKYRGDLIIDDWDLFIKDLQVKNIGDVASGATEVCIVLSEDKAFNMDDLVVKKVTLPALEPGQVAELSINIELMSLNVPYGNYYVGVIIDCEDKVDEYDDLYNNICYWDVVLELEDPGKPDLTCEDIGTIYCDDWDILLKDIWIQNIGKKASEGAKVCVYLSKDNDFEDDDNILVKTMSLPALGMNASAELNANIELMSLDIPYGTYYVALVIDCEDEIMESNEDNNICIYDKVVKLEAPKHPDLTCKYLGDFQLGGTGTNANSLLSLKDVIIINNGDAKSDATKVAFYLSENDKITTADLFLGEMDIPMLDPNEVVDLDFQVDLGVLDVPYGNYFVGIIIDYKDQVSESDEENNICYFNEKLKFEEPGKPDLTCMQLGEMTVDADWKLAIRNLKIINIGNAKSDLSRVGIYLSTNSTITKADFFLGSIVLKMLEPGQTAWLTFDAMLEGLDIEAGSYYVGIIIDDEYVVMESDEKNNVCYYNDKITIEKKKPDLTCAENGTITCDDWDIFIDGAWVQNIGDGPSAATRVCVYLSKDNDFTDGDNYYVDYIDLPALAAGESTGLSDIIELANFKDIIPFGTYYIALVIDCEGDVMESNEDNNICVYEKTITLEGPKKPDLTCAENGTITCDDWDIFIDNVWIQNIGDGPSEATKVCVYLSPDQDFSDNDNYYVDYIDLPALAAGGSTGLSDIIELANFKNIIPFGTYYIALVIDCEDEVMESNEDNNICVYEKTITLEGPKKPDLTCLENGNISCDDWDIFIEDAWIKNIGNMASEPTSVCVYLSPDPDFSDNDNYLVETIDLGALEPGETAGITEIIELANFKGIVPYGTYYIALVIDCEDKVMESDEDNNTCNYYKTITLEEPKKADLMCKELGYMQVKNKELRIWDVWVGNMAVGASVKTDACFYLSKDPDFTDGNNYLIATVDLDAIEAWGTGALGVTVDLSQFEYTIPFGEYYLAVVLDCSDKVLEINEDNNICVYNKKVSIAKPPLPDLICADVGTISFDSIPNEILGYGYKKDALLLSIEGYKARNIGVASSSATTVGVYLSSDDHFGDPDDILIESLQLSPLSPYFSRNFNVDLEINTKDLPAGAYYIGYIVDNEDKVYESNEDNNQCHALTQLYHLIEPPLDCACIEATENYLCESFDKYQAGSGLDQQTSCWAAYVSYYDQGNNAIDAIVKSGIGIGSSQALRIDKEGQNMVMSAPNYSKGIYRTSWMMKIPEDSSAYVSILNSAVEVTYAPTEPIRGLQFTFGHNTPGEGQIIETGESFDYPEGEWFEVEVVFDFRFFSRTYWIKVNGEKVSDISVYAGRKKIGAMNFAAFDSFHNFIVDNIQIELLDELPQEESQAGSGGGLTSGTNNSGNENGNGSTTGNGQNGNSNSGTLTGGGLVTLGLNSTQSSHPDETAAAEAGALTSGELSGFEQPKHAIKQYTIYPNPTSGQFRIDLSLRSVQDVDVFILNSMGQVVRRVQFDQVSGLQESIDLSDQPAGLYLIRTQVGEQFYNNRLLLEK